MGKGDSIFLKDYCREHPGGEFYLKLLTAPDILPVYYAQCSVARPEGTQQAPSGQEQ